MITAEYQSSLPFYCQTLIRYNSYPNRGTDNNMAVQSGVTTEYQTETDTFAIKQDIRFRLFDEIKSSDFLTHYF